MLAMTSYTYLNDIVKMTRPISAALGLGRRWVSVRLQSITFVYWCRNGYRYSHSYYGIRIGNRTQAFEWNHFDDL